jgi:hypothetical protein
MGGMMIDVTLEGGPVVSLQYELGSDVVLGETEVLELTATVNGFEMALVIDTDSMEGFGM